MLSVGRITRDHRQAGSVNSLLAPWGFVDDHTFLTKAGHVGVIYRLRPLDFECLDHGQRRQAVHRFEAAVRLLDEHCRVYQYLCKRRIDPIEPPRSPMPAVDAALRERAAHLNARRTELYDIDIYLALVYEGMPQRWRSATALRGLFTHPADALKEWLSARTAMTLLEDDVDLAVRRLHHHAAAFELQVADTLLPTRLPKADAFTFLRRLVNYPSHRATTAGLRYDTHLDFFMADANVECHRHHLDIGDACVRVLSMKEPPAGTFAHLLEDLYTVPGEWVACLEWRRLPNDGIRREINSRRRHFFNKRVALVNYVAPETGPDEMLVDDSAGAVVQQLGQALTAMEVDGHFFGECSLTLACFDRDRASVDRAVADAQKVLGTHDGTFVEESYNLLNAWLSIVPGNSAHNLRRLAMLETNVADLGFLFTLDVGNRTSAHLGAGALAVFETRHHTPYFYNLHVADVGHTVILGATGSGKSFLLNFLLTHLQQYGPDTVIFDLGHSYRKLAERLEGSYLELGLQHDGVRINPFALPATPENLHFLHAFVAVLLEGTDGYRLRDAEDRELYEAIDSLYVLDRTQRRLFTLSNLLPRALSARLSKWVEGGRYAALFDNTDDTLAFQRFQVFDFEAMRAYPALLEPLLFYVLHRVGDRISDPASIGTLKVCVMDEAWRFIQHERLRRYVEDALKTWRKRNASMLLATQTIEDFASADLLRTVVEGCPTKLLLANPAMDRQRYADLFQLNQTELDLLAALAPRSQFLLKRPDLAKVLTLAVDPASYWLYTNTPADNARADQMFRDHGFSDGLDRLAASA